jgi:phospholipid transport system substrate-binding protein
MSGARRLLIVVAAALTLIPLVCPRLEAGPPTDALRHVFTEANKVLGNLGADSQAADPLSAIRLLLSALFELRDVAELTLGHEWRVRTAAEQDEFIQLFTDLLELSYVQMVAAVAYANAGVRVHYLGEAVDQDTATVRTAIVSRKRGNVLLDYAMARHDDRWTVRDILIEGISLTANYRAQFQRIIRESSYPELVARIKARTADWTRLSAMAAEGNTVGSRMGRARFGVDSRALLEFYQLQTESSQAP